MLYNLFENRDFVSVFAVALLAEGVDRNMLDAVIDEDAERSPSSRRAWIEIKKLTRCLTTSEKSPSSRRAWIEIPSEKTKWQSAIVALLAEGVDRNLLSGILSVIHIGVALLAEGVDRNARSHTAWLLSQMSPSSRRAWIEIAIGDHLRVIAESPSSRRAWIEIFCIVLSSRAPVVALLAEGVDRNYSTIR